MIRLEGFLIDITPGLVTVRREGLDRSAVEVYADRGKGIEVVAVPGPGRDVTAQVDPPGARWARGRLWIGRRL